MSMQKLHKNALSLLYPPVSYDIKGDEFLKQCEVDGNVFDTLQRYGLDILNVIQPQTSDSMLVDWERVYNLSRKNLLNTQRIQNVIAQINAVGGLSIPYLTRVLISKGYQNPKIIEPSPFRAGVSHAGETIWTEEVVWLFVVEINKTERQIHFRAGSSVSGEPLLTSIDNSDLKRLLEDLKPAHTRAVIRYREDANERIIY